MSVQNNSRISSPVELQTLKVLGQTSQDVINKVQLDKTLTAKKIKNH